MLIRQLKACPVQLSCLHRISVLILKWESFSHDTHPKRNVNWIVRIWIQGRWWHCYYYLVGEYQQWASHNEAIITAGVGWGPLPPWYETAPVSIAHHHSRIPHCIGLLLAKVNLLLTASRELTAIWFQNWKSAAGPSVVVLVLAVINDF